MVEYKSRARAPRVSSILSRSPHVNGLYHPAGPPVTPTSLPTFFGNGFGTIVSVIEELSVFFSCTLCTTSESSTPCAALHKASALSRVSPTSASNRFAFSSRTSQAVRKLCNARFLRIKGSLHFGKCELGSWRKHLSRSASSSMTTTPFGFANFEAIFANILFRATPTDTLYPHSSAIARRMDSANAFPRWDGLAPFSSCTYASSMDAL
mmetsp:Transcript_235/g.857  ORF Transcript_235/g.857 Transcript_235/m.857 type:complete len:209 (+) Transcript_235:2146-2772(+)